MFAVIIHGPSAINTLLMGGTGFLQGETMVSMLGLTHTTPGAIAGTCVIVSHSIPPSAHSSTILELAHLALSADNCLQAQGQEMRINYQDDYDHYLQLLIDGLDKCKKSIFNIFWVWDQTFFPATLDMGFVARSWTANDDVMAQALELLNAGEEEVEEEGEEKICEWILSAATKTAC